MTPLSRFCHCPVAWTIVRPSGKRGVTVVSTNRSHSASEIVPAGPLSPRKSRSCTRSAHPAFGMAARSWLAKPMQNAVIAMMKP